MKKIIIICFAFFLLGCEKNQETIRYNTDESYIYFALKDPLDVNNTNKEKFLDSVTINFALLGSLNVTDYFLKVPVNIIGLSQNVDREFSYEISPNSKFDSNLIQISDPIIGEHKIQDSLEIHIKNDVKLNSEIMVLQLDLVDNTNFKVGHEYNRSIKIAFTNQLVKPTWWTTWQPIFGPYYREVYQAWIQIYQEGLDPTLGPNQEPYYYYWNNMPTTYDPNFAPYRYPVLFLYITKLQRFFIDNVVYPNGDSTKPRILLP